ncbi:MAG: hypothetical protein M3680_35595, partial [Myxococcota bacterium]|nr:hypothetical protein [Myxococcota bacterium]
MMKPLLFGWLLVTTVGCKKSDPAATATTVTSEPAAATAPRPVEPSAPAAAAAIGEPTTRPRSRP